MKKPTEKEITDFTTYRANHVALVQKLGQVALNKNFSEHDFDKINAVGKELDLFALRNASKKNEKNFSEEDLNILRKVSAKHAKNQKHHAEYWDPSITIKNFKADDTNVIHASRMPKKYIAEMACDWAACALYHNEPVFGWYNKVIGDTLLLTNNQKEYLKKCLLLIKRAIKKYDITFPGVKYDCEQVDPIEKLKEYKAGDRVKYFRKDSFEKGTVLDMGWSPDDLGIRTFTVKWDDKEEPEEVYDFMLEPLKEDGPCNSSGSFSAMAPEKMHLIKTVLPEEDPFTSNENKNPS